MSRVAYMRDYYTQNKERIKAVNAAYRRAHRVDRAEHEAKQRKELRQWLDNLKSAPCTDCNRSFPPICMDWDHVRGKRSDVSYLVSRLRPKDVILREIAKCELVCSNCHRIRTHKRRAER